ncbi:MULTISPECIES: replication-associated recombination protein A [Caproicibacterium]|jgi:putative ATPase|uniref:AAA family ATPase n=1 Tax=Caproicibacterium lactatifermentans TaxID=2666138 RepID=A0A859DRN6_9FIRM|nr:replication-associated recombination protein A [Caproicibacterium lactatifermentans]ARP50151.1 ATPase [Ruminococcaceae bacterium CPB6]MDD4807541.1 replication-associated recombination protein A [Oscillospiraceae bacterium]QKN24125.1 AAA family ATPase [Caproicibacterium lactatifermentans]QKO30806.1 AAA family ATPase [Caproicibacterium lactatifermentans]
MSAPLADRIRPKTLDDIVGQQHLLGPGRPLRRIIESGEIPNLVFYGPSGVGKTTLASIIARRTKKHLCKLNGTSASTADIRAVVSKVGTLEAVNGILLYLDEIQYFNKKQQQTLLEFIENGDITLIASTTENPYFYVYNAILSRSTVFEFKPVEPKDIVPAVERAFRFLSQERGKPIKAEPEAVRRIAFSCGGDVRKAMNAAELCALAAEETDDALQVTPELAAELTQSSAPRYDREGDEHYDIVSAYQKSMRGSDPDAALHYLARLLAAGDLPSACRRLMVCACEDVGLAYPQIIPIVKAAVDAAQMVGLPEARIPLSDAVILVSLAPKSNSGEAAIDAALTDVKAGRAGPVPRCLQNKHYDSAEVKRKGQFYKYPHIYPNHWVQQQYLPDTLQGAAYYTPGENKTEQSYAAYWRHIKKEETPDK